MAINPDDYQPEEENIIDLSLTRDEKIQLAFYIGCILFGVGLMLGLWNSYGIVHQHEQTVQALHNISNMSMQNVVNQTKI